MTRPRLSVVIPTRDRGESLEEAIGTLSRQSLPREAYELVVVDDGSTDGTRELCSRLEADGQIVYHRLARSGAAAAKNLGVFAAQGDFVLFFDDEDLADDHLLEEHLAAHEQSDGDDIVVLGHAAWEPSSARAPVMEYVTGIGRHLLPRLRLADGETADFTDLAGGRFSCRRTLLTMHGSFDQSLTVGCEDVELGYRLARMWLRIVHRRRALSYLRPVTYAEYCSRCEALGRALCRLRRVRPTPEIAAYCRVDGAEARWAAVKGALAEQVQRVEALEARLAGVSHNEDAALRFELHALYARTFEGFRLKGVVEAGRDDSRPPGPRAFHGGRAARVAAAR